jgi:hypothetical protein
MNPYEWVEAMKELREGVIEHAARVLDVRSSTELAADPLQNVLDRYSDLDVDLQDGIGGLSSDVSLEVRCQQDTLFVWAFPSEQYESLVYTNFDYWWFDHRGVDDASLQRHEIHRSVARRVLNMLPWAHDDDLLEIAAIEIASRAGE